MCGSHEIWSSLHRASADTQIPLLDHLVSELESRFKSHNQATLQGLYLVPSVLVTKYLEEIATKVQQLGEIYLSDLPYY